LQVIALDVAQNGVSLQTLDGKNRWNDLEHEKLQTNFGTKMLFSLQLLKISIEQ
jgi:hypothetical protein